MGNMDVPKDKELKLEDKPIGALSDEIDAYALEVMEVKEMQTLRCISFHDLHFSLFFNITHWVKFFENLQVYSLYFYTCLILFV